MNPYLDWISEYERVIRAGLNLPLGGLQPGPRPSPSPQAPKVMIFSPHPDDEVVMGGLALRLSRESAWNVVNVPVTLGSNLARQSARLEELRNSCASLGFVCQPPLHGLPRVHPRVRETEPEAWRTGVRLIAEILTVHRPRVILFPHELDWNSTHIGTHWLVRDALGTMPADFACDTVETEYWGQNPSPNLMVELGLGDVAELIGALTCHVGEVKRNPFHVSLPAWLTDNVRRGAEVVGGQGVRAPGFQFALLHRQRRWESGTWKDLARPGRLCACKESAAACLG